MSAEASPQQLAFEAVTALHAFFVAWFRDKGGAVSDFSRCEAAFAPDLRMIGPDGRAHARDAILRQIRDARGTVGEDFNIRILDGRTIWADGNAILLEYVEEQYRDGRTTRRRSTALLSRALQAPHGMEWRHLQETWMDAAQDETG
jgi:hypothetical protein